MKMPISAIGSLRLFLLYVYFFFKNCFVLIKLESINIIMSFECCRVLSYTSKIVYLLKILICFVKTFFYEDSYEG